MISLEPGFAIIENGCSVSECDALIEELATISGPGTRCLLDRPWCRSLASSLRQRLAASLPELSRLAAVQCTFFNKSPTNNWLVAFHQDRSIPVSASTEPSAWPGWSRKEGTAFVQGPDELMAEMVALRLHLDDCTADNGPLRVIAGSHRSGSLSPEAIVAVRESSADQPLLVSKGGVIAMRPLLLHASSKSRATDHRRVLHFLYGPPENRFGIEWNRMVS